MRSGETTRHVAGRARVRGPGGILLLCVGALALWVVLLSPNAFAQEPRQEPGQAPNAPAPVAEGTPPQPQEPRPEPSSPPPAKEVTAPNVLADISGLIMQPIFLAIRLPVAVMGGVAGGVLWPFGGASHDSAHQVWNATVGPPWSWPDFVRGLGEQSPPPQ